MKRTSITLPVYNTSMARLGEMARWAEEAGFAGVWPYEICRNPYLTLAAAAATTSRIALGTAIALAFSRSPFVTANAAADVDELSNGRMILGLGPGEGQHLTGLHNTDLAHAIPRMREYVDCVRLTWDSLATGKLATYEGTFYRLRLDEGLRRPLARPRIPIYLAAMESKKMMELAGEIADGLLAFFFSVRYLQEVGRPRLAAGARRAGRDPASVDLCSYIICSVSKNRAEALRRARIQVGFYAFLHSSDAIIRFHGLEQEQATVRAGLEKEGPGALERVTDDKLVETFSIAGTPDECRRQFEAYRELVPLPLLHVPYFEPLSAAESEDAFRNVLETFGH